MATVRSTTSAVPAPGDAGGGGRRGPVGGKKSATFVESIIAAWAIPDLRGRILFVFAMFGVYVVGLHIPIPNVNRVALGVLFGKGGQGNGLLNLVDVFSGGALKQFTVFAMGIIPYINASIIMQLLTFAIPQWQELSREGESGRKELAKITRIMTVGLAALQAAGLTWLLTKNHIVEPTFIGVAMNITILVAGTSFLMWLGEMITDKGIGNGVSLIIFCGIMVRLPSQLSAVSAEVAAGTVNPLQILVLILAFFGTVVGIVFMTLGQRRVPIQNVRRIVGNKMTQGGTQYLPFRVNSAGVIPIIFAVSIQLLPLTLAQYVPETTSFGRGLHFISDMFTPGKSPYWYVALASTFIYAGIIIFFTYFWTAVMMDIPRIAQDLRKYGSYIPGIRQGKPTEEYLDKVMTRITLAGAIFLALVALLQYWIPTITSTGNSFTLVGGTSMLIVVGVALDTMQAIESQLLMRHYEGFIR